MVATSLRFSFSNDFREGKLKVNKVLTCLKNECPDLSEDTLFDLRLIYNELIINGIIHGNKQDLSKKVYLIVDVDTNMITSIVRDEGIGYDYVSLCQRQNTNDLFQDRGRGLQLVLSLSDLVKWNQCGNEVTFCKKISSH